MKSDILISILKAPNLPQLIAELNQAWEDEQKRRHEFWANVDENLKAEFILGEIIYHSPIYGRHWMASTQLCRYLIPYIYDNKLGKLAYEKVMIRLTRNDYEPDICFWRTDKAKDFQATQSAFPAPDFVVEILSESTAHRDRGIKMDDYALHQVQEYWIIDPEHQTLEQYILKNQSYELALKLQQGIIESLVISGFKMEVSAIFIEN